MKKTQVVPAIIIFIAFGALRANALDNAKGDVLLFADELEELLLKKASSPQKGTPFKSTLDALSNHEFSKALNEAKIISASFADFMDYHHFLAGKAEQGRMEKFLKTQQYATALVAGEQALYHWSQILKMSSSPALIKKAQILMGETEIQLGSISLKAARKSRARKFFELGFTRLQSLNFLTLTPVNAAIDYAVLCEGQKTEICIGWVSKLMILVDRKPEYKMFQKLIASSKKPLIPPVSRQIPYRANLDLEAFVKALSQYLKQDYNEALLQWKELLKNYPQTTIKLRTKFWMARSAQRTEYGTQAETLYKEIIQELPFSYYALLASWKSGIDLARMIDLEVPQTSTSNPLLNPVELSAIQRAEKLLRYQAPELASIELENVKSNGSMSNEFLVYYVLLNHLASNHLFAFRGLSELSNRGFKGFFSSYGQKFYFPTTYLNQIKPIADAQNVDPLLILSIIKQESAFNFQAISSANAFGLMQIIPPTARDLDSQLNLLSLFQPDSNIRLGVKYVRQLLNRYKGNVIYALAGYNAGPGNSDRWLKNTDQSLPPEEIIEQITFRETRDYVQNILRNYYWYNRRLNNVKLTSLDELIKKF